MRHLAEALEEWLKTRAPRLEVLILDLAALDDETWCEFVRSHPRLISVEAAESLTAHAHYLVGREPKNALLVARLATRIVEQAMIQASQANEFLLTAGDAYKEYAAALFDLARFTDAIDACSQAEMYYGLRDVPEKTATLDLLRGQVLHRLGQREKGIQVVESSANLLLSWCNNPRRYVEGRTILAGLLFREGRYEDAARVLDDSIEYAQSEGDSALLAYIVDQTGAYWYGMGDLPKAKECLDTALRLFTEVGMASEALRVREGLAKVLATQGRYNEAVSEQFTIRSEYLRMGMPVVAAIAGLEVLDYLFLAGRTDDVRSLCLEMIQTFSSARLPDRAMRALAHLNVLAQKDSATEDTVGEVKAYLRALRSDPETEFPFGEFDGGGAAAPAF